MNTRHEQSHCAKEASDLIDSQRQKIIVDTGTERQIVIIKIGLVKNIVGVFLLSGHSLQGEGERRN